MEELVRWLESNAVLLGSLAAIATIATLFFVNGGQMLGAFLRRRERQIANNAAPEAATALQ